MPSTAYTYEIRADYADETFEVFTVSADNYGEALAIARRDPEVTYAEVLCTIDQRAQHCLLYG